MRNPIWRRATTARGGEAAWPARVRDHPELEAQSEPSTTRRAILMGAKPIAQAVGAIAKKGRRPSIRA